jgi:hypothetical protein
MILGWPIQTSISLQQLFNGYGFDLYYYKVAALTMTRLSLNRVLTPMHNG